jgi:CRP-like cAMP-binding protein
MRPVDLLAGFPLLAGLSDKDIQRLDSAARLVTFAKHERIFEQDRPATACWLLQQGGVAIDTTVPGRDPVLIQTLGPGDILGWSWLVSPPRWHFGAVAVEPTTAIELDAAMLRELAVVHPDFGYALASRFLGVLLDRLQATRARLLDLYRSPHVR